MVRSNSLSSGNRRGITSMESTSLIAKGVGVEIFPGYETSVSCEPMLDGNIL